MKILNLGSRNNFIKKAINVDFAELKFPFTSVYQKINIMELDLHFEANTFDKIIAHHFMEHLTHAEIAELTYQIFMLLKPGGELEIKTPDFFKLINRYKEKHIKGDFSDVDVLNIKVFDADRETTHRSVWYKETGKYYLEREGFFRILEISHPSPIEIQFNCIKI